MIRRRLTWMKSTGCCDESNEVRHQLLWRKDSPQIKQEGIVLNPPPGVSNVPTSAPDFIVTPGGTAFPVPKGATGPVPVINQAGKRTGTAFTGGRGGTNGQVDTIRIMDPTPPRGRSPGYPGGYIKYENSSGQGVNPHTGRTGSREDTHFSIDR